jgi:hypothetical protein
MSYFVAKLPCQKLYKGKQMRLPGMNHGRLMVFVPVIAGVLMALVLIGMQDPIFLADGVINFENPLDPHMFIIYIMMAIILSAALVDFVHWLGSWCQKQHEKVRGTATQA